MTSEVLMSVTHRFSSDLDLIYGGLIKPLRCIPDSLTIRTVNDVEYCVKITFNIHLAT